MRDEKYLELLAEKYPTEQAVCREIINLKAILSLPKGTEHFMSDLHGEYEAFCHILNNCSGVIREKVDLLFEDTLSDLDREEICTLIYYPVEKLAMIKKEGKNNEEWYRVILGELIDIARLFSSKYTRSKVRKAMPKEYAYILDELIHVQKDEDDNQLIYHRNILDTLLELQNADEFIEVLAGLIKRLAVDHLHIVGDIFDRGPCADRIMDLVGIEERLRGSYPHELDGGRRQRVGIGRALALNPKFIVCDEPVSALDVSIQAQVLNLLMDLQEQKQLTYMFVTHDLSVVRHISDNICVMYLGQLVETCSSKKLFEKPLHPYTQALLSAIPSTDVDRKMQRVQLKGELTSPINPKPGCRFAARCPYATAKCQEPQQLREIDSGHFVQCCRIEEID